MVISYDKNKKLAVRQYAINNEFDIKVEKSCKTIYRVFLQVR